MNETLKTLKTRRSIRSYKSQQILKDILEEILNAGMYAPTGMGMQSPIMIAVQKPEQVKLLSRLNAQVMGTSNDPFYGAPTVIVVLADKERSTYVEDGSLVMGNLMNAAASLGIGSCWIHRAREMFESSEGKEFLRSLGVDPERYAGIGNCILGYGSEPGKDKPRKDNYVIWA